MIAIYRIVPFPMTANDLDRQTTDRALVDDISKKTRTKDNNIQYDE